MKHLIRIIVAVATLLAVGLMTFYSQPYRAAAMQAGNIVYLPQIFHNSVSQSNIRTVNAPYIQSANIVEDKAYEMSLFWFGKVRQDTNYADVRVGYNDEALWIHTASIDRRLWYNGSPNTTSLETWDAVTLLIHIDGDTPSLIPTTQSYRFVSQLRFWEGDAGYQKSYRGNGTQWAAQNITFTTIEGWRGNAPNDTDDDHGWTMSFKIPFSSLGLAAKPQTGTTWRIGVMLHDRDVEAGPALTDQVWPELLNRQSPATWGVVRFGLPTFSTPDVTNLQTTTIRHNLNGQIVTDAAAGGGSVCGEGMEVWSQWAEKNYAGYTYFNIQNQMDVSEWPCFSKYYITFPLNSIPAGKTIRSAKLVLYEFGGSDPSQAYPSIIHIFRINQDWSETTLNWNNAPYALEDVSKDWVGVYDRPFEWPGDPYDWDVSRAVAMAYQEKTALRLVIYSTDTAMHSGKYFFSSDTDNGNAIARPTLTIEWGDPR